MNDKLIIIPIENVDEDVFKEIIKDLEKAEINFKIWEVVEND